jgi:fructose-bisphosphate aldolase class I
LAIPNTISIHKTLYVSAGNKNNPAKLLLNIYDNWANYQSHIISFSLHAIMIHWDMTDIEDLARDLVAPGKGILAADESTGTIKKRFEKIGIPDTIENHRLYRELLFTTPAIEKYISGVILFEETLKQSDDAGKPLPAVLSDNGIIPGIKVDTGKQEFQGSPREYITKGLDGLSEKLEKYKELRAKFAKWRNVYVIDSAQKLPSDAVINENAKVIAKYAKTVQDSGMVPIVEPEVLMEGTHTIDESRMATVRVLKRVFENLSQENVVFSAMLLKPNWIHPGLDGPVEPNSEEVASATIAVLKDIVPSEVPGIVFLSGGDSPDDSTEHLASINKLGNSPEGGVPWQLSFSFGRALQSDALAQWRGKPENVNMAQTAFIERAKRVSEARSNHG